MRSRKSRSVARRSLRNSADPIAYPAGMKPVRSPFITHHAEYVFDNWLDGTYRLVPLASTEKTWASTLGVIRIEDGWQSGVRDEAQFFEMKPRLVSVDRKQLALNIQDVYVSLADPDGDDLRGVVNSSAELFARITGTKKVSLGRTKASVAAARKQLMRDVRGFAEANRIDPYEGRAL